MKKCIIVGLGNPYRMDDSVGIVAVDELKKNDLPSSVEVRDGTMDEFGLLDLMKQTEHLVIIDAISAGKEPGTIYNFDSKEIKSMPNPISLSLHTFGLAGVIEMARRMKIHSKITIVGIEPQSMEAGEELTPLISSKISELVDRIKNIAINQ